MIGGSVAAVVAVCVVLRVEGVDKAIIGCWIKAGKQKVIGITLLVLLQRIAVCMVGIVMKVALVVAVVRAVVLCVDLFV